MKKVIYETFKDILEDCHIEDIINELIEYDSHNYVFFKGDINFLIGGLLDNKTIHSFYLGEEKTKNALIDKQEILNLIESYVNKYSDWPADKESKSERKDEVIGQDFIPGPGGYCHNDSQSYGDYREYMLREETDYDDFGDRNGDG